VRQCKNGTCTAYWPRAWLSAMGENPHSRAYRKMGSPAEVERMRGCYL
jgi:hypothetical protein